MRILTLLLIVFLNTTFATGQTYSAVTSDKEIYDFLNWMTVNDSKNEDEPKLSRKHISNTILRWDTANFIPKDTLIINGKTYRTGYRQYLFQKADGTDTIFQQQDRAFLLHQFKAIKDSIWHEHFSKSTLLTKKKQIRPNRYYYSIPLFSVDKTYVIIRRMYYCGSLCTHGGYYIYRKIDRNKWEFVMSVHTGIS